MAASFQALRDPHRRSREGLSDLLRQRLSYASLRYWEGREAEATPEGILGMTVVVMGLTRNDQLTEGGIIAVCDKMLSNDTMTQHLPYAKLIKLHDTWLVGYAGLPEHLMPIYNAVRLSTNPASTSDQIYEAFAEEYRKRRQGIVEALILGSYGLTMGQFVQSGLKKLGVKKFSELCAKIEKYDMGTEFIVGGWQPGELWDMRISAIVNPGIVRNKTMYGFHAIGIGDEIAIGHLAAVYDSFAPGMEPHYRILESKFMAESSPFVGPESVLYWVNHAGEFRYMPETDLLSVRKGWSEKRKDIPLELLLQLNFQPWL